MAELFTPKGDRFLVDENDLEVAKRYCWRLTSKGYPATRIAGKLVLLHRLLLDAKQGEIIDHINGDRRDARRRNLRKCSHAENQRNRKCNSNNRSGFKGIHKTGERWRATIKCDGKRYSLGQFSSPEEAHAAYCKAAIRLHGEFARFS